MLKPVLLFAGLFLIAGVAGGAIETPKNQPVEITSTGGTTYENGLATAHDNVAIHIGDTDIYADAAQYQFPDTRDLCRRQCPDLSGRHALPDRSRDLQHGYQADSRAGNAHRLYAVLRLGRECHFHLG